MREEEGRGVRGRRERGMERVPVGETGSKPTPVNKTTQASDTIWLIGNLIHS